MTTDVALMVYSLGGGGVERMRIHLAEGLQRRGFATTIVVARSDGRHGTYRARLPPGVGFVDFEAHSWRTWLDLLTTYLRNERPRILIAATETAGVIALTARRLARVPTQVVVSSHVEVSRHIRNDWKPLKRLVVPQLMRWLYRQADGIVAVSSGVADDLAHLVRLPRDRIQVIYNPVVTDSLREEAKKTVNHPWLDERPSPLVIGVGRLTPQKDFGTLLRSFAQVRKDREARLIILGEGEERSSLETLSRGLGLERHVWMPGFLSNPVAYIARASVFVLSSAWEGFGNVLVEALACGCPVVSTDCPSGPAEILDHGRYGRLVPVGDHEALAEAILQTIDNPPDLNLLNARALEFHVDKVLGQYLSAMGVVR